MDRRSFLASTAAVSFTAAAGPSTQAEGYRRCDQIHDRLTDRHIDRWLTQLPLPPVLKTDEIGPSGVTPNPPVGAVEQGTAPEYFWRPEHGSAPPESDWGETSPARSEHIYHETDADGNPVPVQFGELSAQDVVVELAPGWLTRRIVYRPQSERPEPGLPAKIDQPWTGPVIEARLGHPLIVRLQNNISPSLMLDVSMHKHGGHTPAHSDGHPNFLLLPADPDKQGSAGERRDYYYPNPLPLKVTGESGAWQVRDGDWDRAEAQSTMWYHDHAEDITAHNALMGMAGYYFLRDDVEDDLREKGVLPPKENEIPLVFQDVCLCPVTQRDRIQPEVREAIDAYESNNPGFRMHGEARIHFDPFDHNGTLGDIVLTNGAAYPVHDVKPEAYWFRMLNASLARFYNLEFWVLCPRTREPRRLNFLRFGKDSWMFRHPIKQNSVFLGMATRADLLVDFTDLADTEQWGRYHTRQPDGENAIEVFVISTLNQKDGRGPGHGDNEQTVSGFPRGMADMIHEDRDAPMFLTKFRVKVPSPAMDGDSGAADESQVDRSCDAETKAAISFGGMTVTSELREHEDIPLPQPGRINVREFDFERGRGAWQINSRFYDPCIANAVPELWSTELWILRNRSGGWWHPIHIHLESHQQVYIKARNHRGDRIVRRRNGYDPKMYERLLDLSETEIIEAENLWESAFPWQKSGFENEHPDWDHDALARSFDDTVWNPDIKHDTTVLGPNTEVHVLMRFRTFQGPFVFHCHNLNHEDMRMMFQFDPRNGLPGPDNHLHVRKDYWFFHSEHEHCCGDTKHS